MKISAAATLFYILAAPTLTMAQLRNFVGVSSIVDQLKPTLQAAVGLGLGQVLNTLNAGQPQTIVLPNVPVTATCTDTVTLTLDIGKVSATSTQLEGDAMAVGGHTSAPASDGTKTFQIPLSVFGALKGANNVPARVEVVATKVDVSTPGCGQPFQQSYSGSLTLDNPQVEVFLQIEGTVPGGQLSAVQITGLGVSNVVPWGTMTLVTTPSVDAASIDNLRGIVSNVLVQALKDLVKGYFPQVSSAIQAGCQKP